MRHHRVSKKGIGTDMRNGNKSCFFTHVQNSLIMKSIVNMRLI